MNSVTLTKTYTGMANKYLDPISDPSYLKAADLEKIVSILTTLRDNNTIRQDCPEDLKSRLFELKELRDHPENHTKNKLEKNIFDKSIKNSITKKIKDLNEIIKKEGKEKVINEEDIKAEENREFHVKMMAFINEAENRKSNPSIERMEKESAMKGFIDDVSILQLGLDKDKYNILEIFGNLNLFKTLIKTMNDREFNKVFFQMEPIVMEMQRDRTPEHFVEKFNELVDLIHACINDFDPELWDRPWHDKIVIKFDTLDTMMRMKQDTTEDTTSSK